MTSCPTICIVEGDALVRESLSLLVRSAEFNAVAYSSAEEFFENFSPTSDVPSCLILAVRLRGMSGLAMQEELSARNIQIPVIVITGFGRISMAVQAMRAGAIDFLEKPVNREALLAAITRAIDRDVQLSQKLGQDNDWSRRLTFLTPREREVMDLLVASKGPKQIAAELGIDPKTVTKHRSHILDKLHLESIIQVAQHSPSVSQN